MFDAFGAMIHDLTMIELREKYPNLDSILAMHLPLDASTIKHTMGLSDSLSKDLFMMLEWAEKSGCMVCDWEDLKALCSMTLFHIEQGKLQAHVFNTDNINEIWIRASSAQFHLVPLVPGYDGEPLVVSMARSKTGILGSGEEFEQYCARLLERNGYTKVKTTPGSGDHGVDLLAEKDHLTFAFQCKYYSSPVGNAAVQQVYSGKSIYKRNIGVVITNSTFTKQAIDDAEKLGILLWDGDMIDKMK